MDELLARHRKEQRDLQSQITQKKKSASKKTRKAVNDECAKLEDELKSKQQQEIADIGSGSITAPASPTDHAETKEAVDDDDLLAAIVNDSSATAPVDTKLKDLNISDHDAQVEKTTSQQSQKPNRQKARLARRAAEQELAAAAAAKEAANLPDLKARERTRMLEEFEKHGLREKEVAANGHCMYSAIADQMKQLGLALAPEGQDSGLADAGKTTEVQRDDYKVVRKAAARYMSSNPDEFVPFLEEPLDQYVHKVKDTGEWGGQLELLALAKVYGLKINVLQGDGRIEAIEGNSESGSKEAWLAYYRHGFGLGEHYNSLRLAEPKTSNG